jgi:hypothetical protein
MIDENKMAIGSAIGITLADVRNNNLRITRNSISFPIISSTYFHTNCMIRNTIAIMKVTINGPIKDLMMNK